MYFDYFNVLVFTSIGIVFVFANMIVASVLRPKRKDAKGLETYECGEETIGDAWVQFDIRYYTVALIYVIFAVEIAFLFPWALVFRDAVAGEGAAAGAGIGAFVLLEGVLFITILFLGLAYVWAKGDLDWVLHWNAPLYQPPESRPRVQIPSVKSLEADDEGEQDEDAEGSEEGEEEAA